MAKRKRDYGTYVLRDYISEEYAVDRVLNKNALYQMINSANIFSRFLERPAILSDLNDRMVSECLKAVEGFYAPRTLLGLRKNLLSAWNHAYECEFLDERPGRVRRVIVPQKPPKAFTPGQVAMMVKASEKLEGKFKGTAISYGFYMKVAINLAYDTGLRRSDLWRLSIDHISENGVGAIDQHKTGTMVVFQVKPDTLQIMAELCALSGSRIPLDRSARTVWLLFEKVKKLAGMKIQGSFQKLRRTAATQVEKAQPGCGAATRFLGHRSADLARKHYIDPTQAYTDAPSPPPLPEIEDGKEGE